MYVYLDVVDVMISMGLNYSNQRNISIFNNKQQQQQQKGSNESIFQLDPPIYQLLESFQQLQVQNHINSFNDENKQVSNNQSND